jgi:hypothetical protein
MRLLLVLALAVLLLGQAQADTSLTYRATESGWAVTNPYDFQLYHDCDRRCAAGIVAGWFGGNISPINRVYVGVTEFDGLAPARLDRLTIQVTGRSVYDLGPGEWAFEIVDARRKLSATWTYTDTVSLPALALLEPVLTEKDMVLRGVNTLTLADPAQAEAQIAQYGRLLVRVRGPVGPLPGERRNRVMVWGLGIDNDQPVLTLFSLAGTPAPTSTPTATPTATATTTPTPTPTPHLLYVPYLNNKPPSD